MVGDLKNGRIYFHRFVIIFYEFVTSFTISQVNQDKRMGRQERSGRGVNPFQRRLRKQDSRYGRGGARKVLRGTQSHQVGISSVRYNDY